MPNFIEKATFTIDSEKATSNAKKLDSVLLKLHRTSTKLQRSLGRIKAPLMPQSSISRVHKLTNAVNKLAAAKKRNNAIAMRNNVVGGVPRGPQGPRGNGFRGGGPYGVTRPLRTRFPGNIIPFANMGLGFEAAFAGRRAVRAGAGAVMDRSRENFIQRALGLSEDQINGIGSAANYATKGLLTVSKTTALASARNLIMAGATQETAKQVGRLQAQASGALGALLGKGGLTRFNEQSTKFLDLAGVLDKPEVAAKMAKALTQAQLIAGRDLNFQQVLTAARNLDGLTLSLSADAARSMVFLVEEQGRKGAASVRSTNKDLFGAQKNKKQAAQLNTAGLRGTDNALFAKNPFKWVDTYLTPHLKNKLKIDIDNAASVNAALTRLGFADSSRNFLTSAVVKRSERELQNRRASQIELSKQEAKARKSLVGSLSMVNEQYDNATASLTPFINKIASPALIGIARELNNLSTGNPTVASFKAAALVTAASAATYVASNPAALALGVAARQLSVAATRLNAAATKQGSILGGNRGKGKGRRGGLVAGAIGGFLAASDDIASGNFSGAALSAAGSVIGGGIGLYLGGPAGALIGATIGGEIATGIGIDRISAALSKIVNDPKSLVSGAIDYVNNSGTASLNGPSPKAVLAEAFKYNNAAVQQQMDTLARIKAARAKGAHVSEDKVRRVMAKLAVAIAARERTTREMATSDGRLALGYYGLNDALIKYQSALREATKAAKDNKIKPSGQYITEGPEGATGKLGGRKTRGQLAREEIEAAKAAEAEKKRNAKSDAWNKASAQREANNRGVPVSQVLADREAAQTNAALKVAVNMMGGVLKTSVVDPITAATNNAVNKVQEATSGTLVLLTNAEAGILSASNSVGQQLRDGAGAVGESIANALRTPITVNVQGQNQIGVTAPANTGGMNTTE